MMFQLHIVWTVAYVPGHYVIVYCSICEEGIGIVGDIIGDHWEVNNNL